jgi:Protein of unknown function (DUF4056)
MGLSAVGSDDWGPPSPGIRHCCLLAPDVPGFPFVTQILDPTKLGRHSFGGGGKTGVVYTCRGGFIDFGHLRDLIDLTYYYVVNLTKRGVRKVGGVIKPYDSPPTRRHLGAITVVKDIPDSDLVEVARSMAFDESVMHEIITYWRDSVSDLGQHHSSFSPEDFVSNFVGAYVAGQAFNREDAAFDRAATEEIVNVMNLLEARTPAQTRAAFDFIKADNWIGSFTPSQSYLKRRNFNYKAISPCYVPSTVVGLGCTGTPTFPLPTEFPSRITAYYTAEYDVDETLRVKIKTSSLKKTDFDAAVSQMKADANARYGANFQCGQ